MNNLRIIVNLWWNDTVPQHKGELAHKNAFVATNLKLIF